MAIQRITIEKFTELATNYLIIDVRSPSEHTHAHIPNAVSIPIFNDEERKVIGTAYKQESRQKAIKIGLDYFGVKMKAIVEQVEVLIQNYQDKTIIVHCWRGGMRSGAISWLLDLYGFKVCVLDGGYKAFRNWVLAQFEVSHQLHILSGYTGSGKTEILKQLQRSGLSVIDLEGLANHKGSSFGNLGLPQQPSNEQFENNLATSLFQLSKRNQAIWLESESIRIGQLNIHPSFFCQMKEADRLNINIPFAKRLNYIIEEYGVFDKEDLIAATKRIKNRLGGLDTKNVIECLEREDVRSAFTILLQYYDKYYNKSKSQYTEKPIELDLETTDVIANTNRIINFLQQQENARRN